MASLRPEASPAAIQTRLHRLRLHPPPGSQQQQHIARSVCQRPAVIAATAVRDTATAAERPSAADVDAARAQALRDPLSTWEHERSGRNEWGCSFAASVAERLLWLGVCCPCEGGCGPAISTLPGAATWPKVVSYITQITRALRAGRECGITSARVLEFGLAFCCCCVTVLSCCAGVAPPPPIWLSAPAVTDEPEAEAREGGVRSAGAVAGRAADDGEIDAAKWQALKHGSIADVEKELAAEPPTAIARAIGRRVGDALWRWGTMVTATATELKARRGDAAAISYRRRLQGLRRLTSWARPGPRGNLLTAKDVAPIVARVWFAMVVVDGAAMVPLEVQQLQELIAELSDRVMAPCAEAGTAALEEPGAEAGTAVAEEPEELVGNRYKEFKEWVSSAVDAVEYASDYASVREAEALLNLQDLWDTAEDERAAEQDVDADGEELLQSLSDEGMSDEEESDAGQQSDAEEQEETSVDGGVVEQEESDVNGVEAGEQEEEEAAEEAEQPLQKQSSLLMHFAASGAANAAERVARDQGHQDKHEQQQEEQQQQEQEDVRDDQEVELHDEEAQQAIELEVDESSDEENVAAASAKQLPRTWWEQVKELRALPQALQAVQASALASKAEYPLRQRHFDEQRAAAAAQRQIAGQAQEQAESERRAELEAAHAKASRTKYQAVERLRLGGDFTDGDEREECLEGPDNLRPDEAEDVAVRENWERISWGADLVWHNLETGKLKRRVHVPPGSRERGVGPKWKQQKRKQQRAYAMPSQVVRAAGEAVARASAERATRKGWWGHRSVAL